MLCSFKALAIASGMAVAVATPALAQKGGSAQAPGQTMTPGGSTIDRDRDSDNDRRNQAQAPERVTPTYHDTPEDRIMREKTDDGAHDRDDTKR